MHEVAYPAELFEHYNDTMAQQMAIASGTALCAPIDSVYLLYVQPSQQEYPSEFQSYSLGCSICNIGAFFPAIN